MLNKSIVILVAAIAFASAHQKRDVQKSESTTSFQNFVDSAESVVKQAGEHISKMLGLDNESSNSAKIVELIKTQAKTFTDQAENIQKQLEEELSKQTNTSIKEVVEKINSKLASTIQSFKEQIEDSGVTEQAIKLQEKFQSGLTSLVEEGKTLAASLEPQVNEAQKTLQDLSRKVIDEVVDNINQLQQKLHTATAHEGNH